MWPFDLAKKRFKQLQRRLTHVNEQIDGVANRLDAMMVKTDQLSDRTASESSALRHLFDRQTQDAALLRAHLEKRVQQVDERLEFVRREILFEIQHGGGTGRAAASATEWAVLDAGKLAAAGPDGARLNLGCGHVALEGYINVDARALPGVDVVADVGDLRLPAGSVAEIFSSHVLEHFPQEELTRKLLPHWHGLLRKGGVFRAVVPDGEAMIKAMAGGGMSYEDFREVLFGAQDYTGDFHFNLFTPQSLTDLLLAAGFGEVTIPARARPNGKCLEFEIAAKA